MSVSPFKNLLSAVSALDCTLPYNWNWQRRWVEVADFLEENPIVLMDVGARGNTPPELAGLHRYVRTVGFEPDPEECRRLNDTASGSFFPTLLDRSSGHGTLQLYQDLGYSSVLTLTDRYQRLFIGDLPVTKRLHLPTVALDDFLAEHPDLSPDFLKLDTQGSELNILRGAQNALSTIPLVEAEVEFLPMYEGQPLFGDVAAYLAEQGYELLYLNRSLVARREIYRGPSRGQLLFGEALFGKREDALGELSVDQRAKYAILLSHYGHRDIAWQLVRDDEELNERVPALRSIFRGHANPAVRAILMQFDKLLAVALHLRRYNQRGTDSDRCWPIR